MKIKSLMAVVSGMMLLMSLNSYAIEQAWDSERYIGVDGWVDSFEEQEIYPANETIPRSSLTTTSNIAYDNKFLLVEDPTGQNGQCIAWEYSKFTTEGTTNHRNSPTFEPIVPTQLFTIGGTGDAMMSFDMYLPENFYCVGSDTTAMVIQVFPKCTGSSSSSDYQDIKIDQSGIAVPGFPVAQLPTGRWFNIKYIVHCDVSKGQTADLYIDGVEIGKNVTTAFKLYGGNGTENIRVNGINSVRFTLTTTNSGVEINPPYRVYMDNMEIRALNDVEVLSYLYMSGFETSDTLKEGFNEFNVKIRNRKNVAITPIIGLMLIKDGEPVSLELKNDQLLTAGSDGDFYISTFVDALDDGDYEMRVFMWDDESTLNSIKSQITIKE